MKIKNLALVAALAMPALASADAKKPTPTAPAATALADADIKLIAHVHAVNEMEEKMGAAAILKGTKAVKDYANTLAKDHKDGDKDLTAFAKTKGLTKIPADAPMPADMKAKMDALNKASGAEYDRQFLDMMVMGHSAEVANLDVMIPNIKDDDLKAKMTALKPILQRHADAAKALQKPAPTASK